MKNVNTTVIDLGIGNLMSIIRGLEYYGAEVTVTSDPNIINNSSHIVLPGDGAFKYAMEQIIKKGLLSTLKNLKNSKTVLLGICIGMQLMATEGKEKGNHKGLGWIAGKVIKIKKKKIKKIPHMGWNTVKIISKHPILKRKKFESYFVHSYNFVCKDKKNILATCSYQQDITAIVGKENIIGTQFHPEKSQKVGLEILKNFVSWNY